jgi:ribosomal protein L31
VIQASLLSHTRRFQQESAQRCSTCSTTITQSINKSCTALTHLHLWCFTAVHPLYTGQSTMLSSQAAVVVALALACLAAPAQAISWPSFSKKSRTMQETDRACAPSTDPDYVCTLDLADGITFHYAVDATNLYGKMDVSGSACYDCLHALSMRRLL